VKFLQRILLFFKEVRLEIKKVNWLTRQEVLRHTIVVVLFSLVVSVYLGALDYIFQWILGVIV